MFCFGLGLVFLRWFVGGLSGPGLDGPAKRNERTREGEEKEKEALLKSIGSIDQSIGQLLSFWSGLVWGSRASQDHRGTIAGQDMTGQDKPIGHAQDRGTQSLSPFRSGGGFAFCVFVLFCVRT